MSELDRAAELLAEARAMAVADGEPFWAAEALAYQGLLALRQLDLATAASRLEAAVAEHQAVGTPVGVARTLFFLGFVRRLAGDLDGARSAFGEAQRLLAKGRVTTWLRATIGLAQTELAAGNVDAAEASFRAAHERANDVGDQRARAAQRSSAWPALRGSATTRAEPPPCSWRPPAMRSPQATSPTRPTPPSTWLICSVTRATPLEPPSCWGLLRSRRPKKGYGWTGEVAAPREFSLGWPPSWSKTSWRGCSAKAACSAWRRCWRRL